jgi:hypothetical protein
LERQSLIFPQSAIGALYLRRSLQDSHRKGKELNLLKGKHRRKQALSDLSTTGTVAPAENQIVSPNTVTPLPDMTAGIAAAANMTPPAQDVPQQSAKLGNIVKPKRDLFSTAQEYADTDIGKNILSYNNKQSAATDAFGRTPTGLDLKYATDPEYVKAQEEILGGYLENGKISQGTYNALLGVVKTRPVSWQSQLPMFLSSKETGEQLGIAKTKEEIEKLRIEKGKAAREEGEAGKKSAATAATAQTIEELTNRNIDNLIGDFETGKGATGLVANTWADLYAPSEAGTRKAYFQQIKSGLTLKKLTDLKAAGGTLGALSDQERVMLDNAASVLDFKGSTVRNVAALRDIKKTLNAAKVRAESETTGTAGGIKYVRDATGKLVRQ